MGWRKIGRLLVCRCRCRCRCSGLALQGGFLGSLASLEDRRRTRPGSRSPKFWMNMDTVWDPHFLAPHQDFGRPRRLPAPQTRRRGLDHHHTPRRLPPDRAARNRRLATRGRRMPRRLLLSYPCLALLVLAGLELPLGWIYGRRVRRSVRVHVCQRSARGCAHRARVEVRAAVSSYLAREAQEEAGNVFGRAGAAATAGHGGLPRVPEMMHPDRTSRRHGVVPGQPGFRHRVRRRRRGHGRARGGAVRVAGPKSHLVR